MRRKNPPPSLDDEEQFRRYAEDQLCRIFRVPVWLVTDRPRPSWLRHPFVRARECWWRVRGGAS